MAFLEDPHEYAVRCPDRQQVECDCCQWNDDRPERREQEQEG